MIEMQNESSKRIEQMDSFKNKLFRKRYEVGFVPWDEDIVLKGNSVHPRFIKNPPKDKWYADPFLFKVTDTSFVVFVEEYRYDHPVGRLAKLVVDRKSMKIVEEKIVLDLSTHLSFPIYYRDGDDVYIYPENSKSGSLNLYKYDKIGDQFVFQTCLVEEPLTDAVMLKWNRGGHYLLATDARQEAGNNNEIKIYHSDTIDGMYSLYQTVQFDRKVARNGGAVISIGCDLYRVAQDCTKSYGYSMEFQKILSNGNGKFSFETVSKVLPKGLQYGTHTFNICDDWAVVDVNVAIHPLLRHLYFDLSKWVKLLHAK